MKYAPTVSFQLLDMDDMHATTEGSFYPHPLHYAQLLYPYFWWDVVSLEFITLCV